MCVNVHQNNFYVHLRTNQQNKNNSYCNKIIVILFFALRLIKAETKFLASKLALVKKIQTMLGFSANSTVQAKIAHYQTDKV